jgi:hypothetical protein
MCSSFHTLSPEKFQLMRSYQRGNIRLRIRVHILLDLQIVEQAGRRIRIGI